MNDLRKWNFKRYIFKYKVLKFLHSKKYISVVFRNTQKIVEVCYPDKDLDVPSEQGKKK